MSEGATRRRIMKPAEPLQPSPSDLPLFMTPQEVADQLRVCSKTVIAWAKRGQLPAFKQGKVYRFRRADVVAFAAASTR